jgi:hypothetical protein
MDRTLTAETKAVDLESILHHTVYAFGSPCDQIYGHLVLRRNGSVYGYRHENERAWRLGNAGLEFIGNNGNVTSTLTLSTVGGALPVWSGTVAGKRWPLMLQGFLMAPVYRSGPTEAPLPPLFINTVPKSGTYLLEKAFSLSGWNATCLHFFDDTVVDSREVAEGEMHRNPRDFCVSCRFPLAAATLGSSSVSVGHVSDVGMLRAASSLGVRRIWSVRNLRDVLVSLFRFKLEKVEPLVADEGYWRDAPEVSRFQRFCDYFKETELRFIFQCAAAAALEDEVPVVRFEDLLHGRIEPPLAGMLNELAPELGKRFQETLGGVLHQRTSTYSGRTSDWTSLWSDKIEKFFRRSGWLGLNRRLGYS